MKNQTLLFLLLLTLAIFPTRAGYCQSSPPKTAAVADLTGTGKQDKIAVVVTGKEPLRFTITVNGTKFAVAPEDYLNNVGDLAIVKLDSTSKTRQIMLTVYGDNDYDASYFFGWNGKTIRKIGVIPQVTEPPTGNGALYSQSWMGFWQCSQKFAYNAKTQTIGYVPQSAYFVGVPTTAKASFPVYRDHMAGSPLVANVAPNSKIQLLLFWNGATRPEIGDDGASWYLIKTQTGLCGWARFKTFQPKVADLPYAG